MPDNIEKLPTKEVLERLKIQAEINEKKKPFYKKPAFYASLVPIILAITGLIFSQASGYFEVQQQRIKNETFELQQKVNKLKDDSVSLENRFTAKNRALIKSFDKRRDSINSSFIKLQDSLENSFRERKANLDNKIFELQKSLNTREAKSLIDQMLAFKYPFSQYHSGLISLMQNMVRVLNTESSSNDSKNLLLTYIKSDTVDNHDRTIFLLCLYSATKKIEYKNQIFRIIEAEKDLGYYPYLSIFQQSRFPFWTRSESFQNIKELKELFDRKRWPYYALLPHVEINKEQFGLSEFNNNEMFIEFVNYLMLEIPNSSGSRFTNLVNALLNISPAAYYCLISEIIIQQELDENDDIKRHYSRFIVRRIMNIDEYQFEVGRKLNVPLNLNLDEWEIWASTNQELIRAWLTEDGRESLRLNKNKLYSLMVLTN